MCDRLSVTSINRKLIRIAYLLFLFANIIIVVIEQAVLCYVPQWLWNIWEGGLISTLVMGMNNGLDYKDQIEKKRGVLMDYLVSHIRVRNVFDYFKGQ